MKEGIPVYVAMAPTLPDEGEKELKETLKKISSLKPVTIFHEPINLRAENLSRIEAKARSKGRHIKSEVFKTKGRWWEYAFGQFFLIEKICDELKLPEGALHQWPDKILDSPTGFLRMKKSIAERTNGQGGFTKKLQEEAEHQWENCFKPWIDYWHNTSSRISKWPPLKPNWK